MPSARSKASVELASRLAPDPKRLTRTKLAAKLGVSKQAIASWCSGVAKPAPETALAIEKLTGIPMQDWLAPVRAAKKGG
jgi:transcriptional regulator with XRE-family HTH domain